jgi:hypothetical protein
MDVFKPFHTKLFGDFIKTERIYRLISTFAAAYLALFAATIGLTQFTFAGTASNTVVASVSIPSSCFISGANSINLGNSLQPDTNYPASTSFTVNDPGGNAASNILIAASGNWMLGSNSIYFGNVIWSNTLNSATGTGLTNTLANTLIQIPAPSSGTPTTNSNVYLGIQIPAGQAPGVYTSNILFQNSCYPSNSVTLTVPTTANVVPFCYISLSTNTINFGSIAPGANVPTANTVVVSNPGGNAAANVLVDGTNWASSSSSFGVSNTIWDVSSQTTYNGVALSNSLAITGIILAAPNTVNTITSNDIYFGLGVPTATVAGTYTQNILIENSC